MPVRVSMLRQFVIYALLMALLAGCSGRSVEPDGPTEGSPAWHEVQKNLVAQRAESRWEAIIRSDFDAAYRFQSPQYRSVFSAQHFRGNFGGDLIYDLARVKSVEYDQGQVAEVSVEVQYQSELPGVGPIRGVRTLREKWLYSDGSWWYTSR